MPLKKQGSYQFGDFEVDLEQRTLMRQGYPIAVSARTFDVLAYFVLKPQSVVTTNELVQALWPHAEVEQSNLGQHIYLLQKALTSKEQGDKLLITLPNHSFQFNAAVSRIEEDPDPETSLQEGQSQPAFAPRPLFSQYSDTDSRKGKPDLQDTQLTLSQADEPLHANEPDRSSLVNADQPADEESNKLNRKKRRGKSDKLQAPEAATSSSRSGPMSPLKIGIVAAVAIAAAISGWLGWRWGHRAHPDGIRIVVGDFDNSTGNPEFDQAIRTALSIELRQSPFLEVTTRDQVTRAMNELKDNANTAPKLIPAAADGNAAQQPGQTETPAGAQDPPPAPLTGNLAREVCQRLKDKAYLTGDIQPFVRKYLVTVKAIDCTTGATIAASKGLARSPDAMLSILNGVAADIRKQLGEPPTSVERFSKPIFSDQTNSFQALKAYSNASLLAFENKLEEALPLYKLAIELDPRFAMAFADMGSVYNTMGEKDLAALNVSKAYALRDSVDEPDRLFITAAYNDLVTRDLRANIHNYRQWAEEYPRDPAPLLNLADLDTQVGEPAQAIDPARRALALNPADPLAYVVLARAQMHLNQFEEATDTCQQAIDRHLDVPQVHAFLMQIAFLRLDQPAIDAQIAWARQQTSDADAEPLIQLQLGMMDLATGKVKTAQAIFTNVASLYRKQGMEDRASRIERSLPRIEAELGFLDLAKSILAKLPTLEEQNVGPQKSEQSGSDASGNDAPTRQPASAESTDLAVAWAEVGDVSRAESMLEKSIDANPSDTLLQDYNGPQVRAAIALYEHHPDAAIDALEIAEPYSLRLFDATYLRAQAYLAAGKPDAAEAEFHKIVDHAGVEPYSSYYSLAQLGVARSLVQEQKLVEATFAYKVVLQIWKDADPDLPRLREARAEFAKLGGEASSNSAPGATANRTPIRPASPRR